MLYRNQVLASNGECMNDSFYAYIFFKRFSIEKEIKESLSDEVLVQLIPFIKFENLPFSATFSKFDEQSLYKSLIQFRETIEHNIFSMLTNIVSMNQDKK